MLRIRFNPLAAASACRGFASRASSALATPARAAAASKAIAALLNGGSSTPPLSSYDEFSADVADDGARGLSRVLGTDVSVHGHGQEGNGRAPLRIFPVDRTPLAFKSIRIALVGAPNAGKSTLMNALCGTKVSAVSPKFNTTRDQVLGYMHIFDTGAAGKGRDVTELVFVDTPGLLPASANTGAGGSKRYVKTLVTAATEALATVDVVLLVVDAARRWDEEQAATLKTVAEACAAHGTRLCLVANKVDLVRHNQRESEARLKLLERRRKKAAGGGGAVVAVEPKAKAAKKGKQDGSIDLTAAAAADAALAAANAASNSDAAGVDSSAAAAAGVAASTTVPAGVGAGVLSGDAWARMVAQSKAAAGVPAADAVKAGDAVDDVSMTSGGPADASSAAAGPAPATSAGGVSAKAAAAASSGIRGSDSSADDAPFIVRTAGDVVESLASAFEAACEASSLPTAIARRRAAKAAAAAEMRSIAREAGIDVDVFPGSGSGASSSSTLSSRASPAAAAAAAAGKGSAKAKTAAAAELDDADAAVDAAADAEDELLPSVYSISARSAEGVDELREALLRCSRPVPRLSFEPPPPPRSGAGAGMGALMQNTATSIRLGSPAAPGSSSARAAARASAAAASGASSTVAAAIAGGAGGSGVREVKATVGTDMSPQERVAEIIREKLFLNLHDEVPYGIAQRTRRWRFYDRRQSADGVETLVVDQELLVPRDSVAAILRARQAGPLKAIGIAAMKDIEAVLGVRVRLYLHAVVDSKLARVGAADAGGSGTSPRVM